MMRTFYVTGILLLGLLSSQVGCERNPGGSTDPGANGGQAPPPRAEVEAALDSIDHWLASAQPRQAEAIARAMVRDAPDLAEGHAALGRVLLVDSGAARSAGRPEVAELRAGEALQSLHRAIELGLDGPEILRNAGIAAEQAGDLDGAIAWYRRGSGSDDAAGLYLGLALLRNAQPAEAKAVLEPIVQRRSEDPFLYAAIAECHSELDDHTRATENIEEAIRLAPNEPAFRIRRAALLRRAGNPRQAAESILALPDDVRVQVAATEQLALALRDLNEPELAAVAWVARAQAFPEDPDAMAKAARAYLDAGNSDEARGWMDLLISNHPDHPELEQLRLDYAETQRR